MHRHCLTSLAFGLLSVSAFAWGPHSEIAQAALDSMTPADPLMQHLGADGPILSQYVWMADWRQQLMVRADEVFYSDDYLLFPAAPKHYDHICPEVKQTYAPYFRRALQALRTESPRNAARWIGALLHFTTDTGSPPHALGISGPTHSKMENWLNAKLIHIPEYHPQLLGNDDAAAEAGFLKRMDGLIEFSKQRAERCRADVEADRRAPVEPVVLESALETARVTADLLHTLGVLAGKTDSVATLAGKVIKPTLDHPSLSRLPAKVILKGTLYSTLTNADGTFAFHHLPPGEYEPQVLFPGCIATARKTTLAAGASVEFNHLDLTKQATGNLVRNSRFTLQWVAPEVYDNWSQPKRLAKMLGNNPLRDWEGEWIPLVNGTSYRLTAKWKPGSTEARVFVRTKAKPDYASLATESTAVAPEAPETTIQGSTEAAWAQICIRSAQKPGEALEEVSLCPVK